jgi:hypothetical protein
MESSGSSLLALFIGVVGLVVDTSLVGRSRLATGVGGAAIAMVWSALCDFSQTASKTNIA